jgi:GAF domain-containing protein
MNIMFQQSSEIQALEALQQRVDAAYTFQMVQQLAETFIQGRLEAASTEVRLASPGEATSTPTRLALPLSRTHYWLQITRLRPFTDEERRLARLGAAILATAPFFETVEQQWPASSGNGDVETAATLENERAAVPRPLLPTLQDILNHLVNTFKTAIAFIALYDSDKGEITFPYAYQHNQRAIFEALSIDNPDSLVAWVISNNRAFVTGNWPEADKPAAGIEKGVIARSIICIPMSSGDEVLGAISVQSDLVDAFTAADVQSLQAVADHVAVIVRHARLDRLRQPWGMPDSEYQTAVALRQAIAIISTSLEQEMVLRNLLAALPRVMACDRADVLLEQNGQMQIVAGRDYRTDYDLSVSSLLLPADLPLQPWQDNELIAAVVDEQSPLVVTDVQTDSRWPQQPEGAWVRSWMAIPIRSNSSLLAVLTLSCQKTAAFATREVGIVTTLATHTAVALQNARLYQKTQQQLTELDTLYQATAMMTANLDQDFVLHAVVSEMVRAVKVDSCTIFVWDEARQNLTPVAHQNQSSPIDPLAGQAEAGSVGLRTIQHLERFSVVRRIFDTQLICNLRVDDDMIDQESLALLEAGGLKSVLLVPLLRRNQVLGLLALGQLSSARHFTPSELRLTQNLAGQAAVAIEHAHLFSQAQRRVSELQTFHEIAIRLNTPLKLSAVLDTITESALKLINASNLHIFLYDAQTDRFTFGSALWRDGRRHSAVKQPRATGLTATVVRQGQPVVINNAAKHPMYQSPKAKAWGIHAIAGFPLRHNEQIIGAFTITYLFPHTFNDDELLLLNLLADQAAVAVKNAHLFAQSQRRLRDMSALVDMAKQVTSNLKLDSILQTTVQTLQGLLKARACTITMLAESGQELVLEAATGVNPEYLKARMRLDESISGKVIQTGQVTYIRDTYEEPDFLFFDDVVRSLLVVPLVVRDRPVGTLSVDNARAHAFSQSDIQLMTIAAAQVSVAIANARLFAELDKRARELAEAYEELKESDRLKDELVQNLSHELRTPLTFVKGYVDLLMDGEMGLMHDEQQEALQIVSDKTNEITRLIDDIITLQRIDTGNLQFMPYSMTELIRTAVTGHRLVADKKGLSIEHDLPSGELVVPLDKGRINQVLDNLIGNAMKFSPDGGTIVVKLVKGKDKVTVSVADQGIGLPQDKKERIFERFYQIDGSSRRRFGGTGLGLAIVKRIVEAHNGRIWVESEVNNGSTFYFTLPTSVK